MCKRHISAPQGKVHRKNFPNQYRAIANAMITSAMSAASGIQQALISAHWDGLGLTESMRSIPLVLKAPMMHPSLCKSRREQWDQHEPHGTKNS